MGAGGAQAFLVDLHVLFPIVALRNISGRELPILFGCFDPLNEPPTLLVLREVQKKFDDPRAIASQVPLQIHDGTVTIAPNTALIRELLGQILGAEDFGMYADDQYLLVIGSIEDTDLAAFRQL